MKRFFIPFLAGIFVFPVISEANPEGTWVELSSTPVKRTESSSALIGDKIYVLGGFTPKGISNKVDVWHPESRVHRPVGPARRLAPRPRDAGAPSIPRTGW